MQRQLNSAIEQEYKGVYVDWYDLFKALNGRGISLEKIKERFLILGVDVKLGTISEWVKARKKKEARA
jgi:hypothetical protein